MCCTLKIFITLFGVFCTGQAAFSDSMSEKLFIKPLLSGHVFAHFEFPIYLENDIESQQTFKHFRLFPRSLGEIISKHSVLELHFSLTQGLWRHEKWGYPVRDSPPGAELWAWFQQSTSDVQGTWKSLANSLSGQFCASLNFIDEHNSVSPKISFRPEGAIRAYGSYNSSFLRYSSLPRETTCTENLTPFKKLLPCDTKAGLSTLLNAIYVLNSHYFSLAVDLRNVCKNKDCSSTVIELKPSVSVVFDPPVTQQGKQDWSFVKLFGTGITRSCPLASESKVYIDISTNFTGIPFTLTPESFTVITLKSKLPEEKKIAVYDIPQVLSTSRQLNVGAAYGKQHIYWYIPPPIIHANRYIAGYGQEHGGIHCSIYNNHPSKSIKVLYLDVIPWFLRVFSHTLSISNNGKTIVPEYQHYQPARDRQRPHHLELIFTLPPNSVTELSMEFKYAFLKWTEYPPDANHGYHIGSSVISALVDTERNFTIMLNDLEERKPQQGYFLRLHTQSPLVSLPTPDFSMPYNVICLSCTVVALAFGPIHNVTTKRLVPIADKKDKKWFTELKGKLQKWWKGKTTEDNSPENLDLKKEK